MGISPGYERTLNQVPTVNLHDFFIGHPLAFAQIILAMALWKAPQ